MSRRAKTLAVLGLGLALAAGLYLASRNDSRSGLERVMAAWLEWRGATLHQDPASSGRPLVYWSFGQDSGATPVILLHGAGGDAMTAWFRLLPALGRDRLVLAPQLPYAKLAASSGSLENFFWEQNDIIRLMDRLGLPRAHLVGLSAGAWVAGLVAMNYPGRVERLALVSPMGLETQAILAPLLQAEQPGRVFLERMFQDPPPLLSLFASGLSRPVEDALRSLSRSLDPRLLERMELGRRLGLVRCPTLVISGAQDRIIPASVPRALAEGIPGARLLVIPDCGHAVVWDQPRRLEEALRGFLEARP